GVGAQRLLDRDLLCRDPAVRVRAVRGASRYRRVHTEQRVDRRDRPVRAEMESGASVEQRAKRIRALNALRPDPLLSPAPVVDRMIGLHGPQHTEGAEAFDRAAAQVLRMLDPEAAVTLAIA